MTGVTTGQTSLPTATDSDDNEGFLTGPLTTALQTLANLFESATGHDHTGAGKGKPIGSAGIASGITLTSPHFTGAVVDSGGLTVTAGGVTVTAGGLTLTAAPLIIGTTVAAGGSIRLPNSVTVGWRNGANSADDSLSFDGSDRLVIAGPVVASTATAGGTATTPANNAGYLPIVLNGTAYKIALFLV